MDIHDIRQGSVKKTVVAVALPPSSATAAAVVADLD
jgi:hypothetical protein